MTDNEILAEADSLASATVAEIVCEPTGNIADNDIPSPKMPETFDVQTTVKLSELFPETTAERTVPLA
jgi:hypothetical protein